ncbi:MAG TPA: tRNA lysidine(34) synthetase TilS [Gemmatimonadaceae bacterium]|nr:tRNA lysidine(34) synthetase TilS [Gemmatimonadaceae bacterium]
MSDAPSPIEIVHFAAAEAAAAGNRLVLAVSGGLDSMVLLDAMAAVAPERVAAVASFDHGTGAPASEALALVRERAAALGLPFHPGRALEPLRGEEAWRDARWRFLREVAATVGGPIVTAHTGDDQLETVVMRILRGAGARGLAGLDVASDVVRPFLRLSRGELASYARARSLDWRDDPSNVSRAHFRNRVRLDLLPALRRARPSIDDELRALASRAADWRANLSRAAAAVPSRITTTGSLRVAAAVLGGYDRESLRVLWPELAARLGVRLDRRGTHRLAGFTMSCAGGMAPLSGGWEVARTREAFELRRTAPVEAGEHPLAGAVRVGRFRFSPVSKARRNDPWWAALPADVPIVVRAWRAGDRMIAAGALAPRRVKRYLSDAGIAGPERSGWPVVLAAGEVVWIPGVRRSDAATARSGGPIVHYLCDRLDR